MSSEEFEVHVRRLMGKKLRNYEARILYQIASDIHGALLSAHTNRERNTFAFRQMGYLNGYLDCLYWTGRIDQTDKQEILHYLEDKYKLKRGETK